MAAKREKSARQLRHDICEMRRLRDQGRRCTAPLELKYKLRRYRHPSGQRPRIGSNYPATLLRREGRRWRVVERFDNDDDAMLALAKLLGPEVYEFVKGKDNGEQTI